jgi:hypothetical protein
LARAGHTPTSRHHLHPMSRACNIIRQQKSPNYHVIWNVWWGQSLRGSVFCSNHGGWLFSPPLIFSLHSLKFVSSQPKIKNQGCPIYCLTIMILFSFDWNFFVLDYFLNCFFFQFYLFSIWFCFVFISNVVLILLIVVFYVFFSFNFITQHFILFHCFSRLILHSFNCFFFFYLSF